jgi:hypothetical protein
MFTLIPPTLSGFQLPRPTLLWIFGKLHITSFHPPSTTIPRHFLYVLFFCQRVIYKWKIKKLNQNTILNILPKVKISKFLLTRNFPHLSGCFSPFSKIEITSPHINPGFRIGLCHDRKYEVRFILRKFLMQMPG